MCHVIVSGCFLLVCAIIIFIVHESKSGLSLCYTFHRTAAGVPVFEERPSKYYAFRIMQILLDPGIDVSRIAQQRPLETLYSFTFVVDLTKLSHPDDIKKDMYGKWLHKGSHEDVFRCSFDVHKKVLVEKIAPGPNVYYLRQLHNAHPSNKQFRRIVSVICGKLMCRISTIVGISLMPRTLYHSAKKSVNSFAIAQ